MSRVILTLNKGYGRKQILSLKCGSAKRAQEIADARPNCIDHQFYDDGASIPRTRKKLTKHETIMDKINSGEINMDNIEHVLRKMDGLNSYQNYLGF